MTFPTRFVLSGRHQLGVGLAAAALACCTPVLADPVPFATTTSASVDASAADGPQPADSHTAIVNGVVTDNVVNGYQGGSHSGSGNTSASGSLSTADVTAFQTGITNGGHRNSTSTAASADLATGLMHMSVHPTYVGTDDYAVGGSASATIADIVTFQNASDANVLLTVFFHIDGAFSLAGPSDEPNPPHYVAAYLEMQQNRGPNEIGLVGKGIQDSYYADIAYNNSGYTQLDGDDVAGIPTTFTGSSSTTSLDWTMSFVLDIPTGTSTIGLGARTNLRCDGPLFCDLSNTGHLGFGSLPTGLSFTSDSGVFLTGDAAAAPVPEPGSWALLMGSLAPVVWLARRRVRSAP